ncbi:hypothetical protein RvY_18242 [Ramazzottius varieornatus]|uniref:Uncharacterized protein n=1 Tax=Ramazzottius varieornatus TaxID=947166 RepID=A0A1D1W5L4_RAMVA|nr:hypothetical protein RvY_18242 [Ramazzottius varieornatus]
MSGWMGFLSGLKPLISANRTIHRGNRQRHEGIMRPGYCCLDAPVENTEWVDKRTAEEKIRQADTSLSTGTSRSTGASMPAWAQTCQTELVQPSV